ncbi:MAG: hypothetical protein R3F49_06880 [Planctomycetota bacterium]
MLRREDGLLARPRFDACPVPDALSQTPCPPERLPSPLAIALPDDGLAARALAPKRSTPSIVVAAKLATLVERNVPGWTSEVIRAAQSDEPAVRAAAIWHIGSYGSREGLVWAVDVLEREVRAGLAWRAVEALRYLTGQDLGRDAAAWRESIDALPLDWTAAQVRGVTAWGTPVDASVADLTKFDPRSDRLGVVVHLAAPPPAKDERPKPNTRRERVIAARGGGTARSTITTDDVLDALRASFRLAPAAAQVHPIGAGVTAARLSDEPSSLSALDLDAMFALFEATDTAPEGDLYAALGAALAVRDVDRILLVTRGGPCGGEHAELELIVDLVLQHAKFRHLVFDVVLVDPPEPSVAQLKRLAEATRGRCLRVTPNKR